MCQILQHSNHVNLFKRLRVCRVYILSHRFYEVYSASEAKITRKVTKYQRELCTVLLQSETVLY